MNLRRAENHDIMDALQECSIKISKSLLECPAIIAFVSACDAKAFNDTELCNRAWLAGLRFLISTGNPTENVTVKYLTKHTAYVFL